MFLLVHFILLDYPLFFKQTMSATLDNLNRDEDAYVGMIEEKKVCFYIVYLRQFFGCKVRNPSE